MEEKELKFMRPYFNDLKLDSHCHNMVDVYLSPKDSTSCPLGSLKTHHMEVEIICISNSFKNSNITYYSL